MLKSVRFIALVITACAVSACSKAEPVESPPITPIAAPAGVRDIVTVSTVDNSAFFDPGSISEPQICSQYNSLAEELYMDANGKLTGYLTVQACGWKESGIITTTLTYPDNRSESAQVDTEVIFNKNFVTYTYAWQPGDQLGPYTISFMGPEGSVGQTLHIVEPVGPRLYRLSNSDLMLYQFGANETVQLFKYELARQEDESEQYQLVAWQSIITDSSGQHRIDTGDAPNQFPIYVAVGEQSGEVHLRYPPQQTDIVITP
ncbi:MAG: hypothetical protein GY943_15255 [Chloroflexi bacterium]|nr:hypothetical protein [Chloroflexota bacterium]